jgi:uncharacterized membrane protein SirB2
MSSALLLIKQAHIICALISVSGFVLRGVWMMRGSSLLRRPAVRVAPHIVDTLLLATAIALLALHGWSPLGFPWLIAKIVGVLVYILAGSIALKYGRTRRTRVTAFILALGAFAYIVAVALSRNPTVIG